MSFIELQCDFQQVASRSKSAFEAFSNLENSLAQSALVGKDHYLLAEWAAINTVHIYQCNWLAESCELNLNGAGFQEEHVENSSFRIIYLEPSALYVPEWIGIM